jgi:hypothetical protein
LSLNDRGGAKDTNLKMTEIVVDDENDNIVVYLERLYYSN